MVFVARSSCQLGLSTHPGYSTFLNPSGKTTVYYAANAMIRTFLNKTYGNGVVLAHLRGQRRVPYLPVDELRAQRDKRLRRIVTYAAKTVPFYRNLFQREGIDPSRIGTAEDLNLLPLLDRELVRNEAESFLSTSRRGENAIPFFTSGSAGRPLKFYHDQRSLLANIAFGERERAVITRVGGTAHGYRELYVGHEKATGRKVRNYYQQNTFIPIRPNRRVLSVLDPIEQVAKEIDSFRPNILISYGSYLELLFRLLHVRSIRMHLPEMLVYAGDSMTKEGRSFIEEQFGIPVLSRYNAVEAFKIGFFCEKRSGFHLHEDLCHVKIVNRAGKEVARGEQGEVVISNLVNRGTVLLNYRLRDLAGFADEPCPCGRTLALLTELEGRADDIIWLSSGEFVHPLVISAVFRDKSEVLRYQLIQHELERFEVRLVTVDRDAYQRIVSNIAGDLKQLLGGNVIIESEYYPELQGQERGKFRSVLSLCGFR